VGISIKETLKFNKINFIDMDMEFISFLKEDTLKALFIIMKQRMDKYYIRTDKNISEL
jgi:hypothetical protein